MNHRMIRIRNAGLLAGALLLAPLALAVEEAADAAAAPPAEATAAEPATVNTDTATPAAPTSPVSLTASGDHVVVVNTGNETVDAASNYAAKCTERVAALKTCEQMGSFKALACRKLAEARYKSATNCPNL